ncbi:hypothetical protein SH1V18_45620 [Vallitalea longa]|uniref:Prolow-density lipoprotein receptor-related protein 1-like beta-propeller domain-containing protein n=1 Tax=Vallitalea longa TaxID=2936439 RepID=A0A9W5YEK9_9FIRM|nr:DUF5050 domain-containing protein [Vallitalea longa]GKX32082.1 hypothetical protein SH1V18_45620 [Vallitalea longa]
MKIIKYIIILMVLCSFVLAGCGNTKKTDVTVVDNDMTNDKKNNLENDNSEINFNEWVYFGNPDDNYKIYRMKTDGTNLTKITDAVFEGIRSLDNWIYYIDTNSKYTPAKLARIKWDGTDKEILSEEDINSFCTSEDYIFYIYENNIYRMQKDGSLNTKIISSENEIYKLNYYNETIYYSTNQGLFSVDSDGKNSFQLLEGNYTDFSISSDRIYYYDNKMYSCNLDGSNETQLFDLDVNNIYVVDDVIYYNQDEYLYKINSYDGKKDELFLEKGLKNFYEKDCYLYFYGQNRIWKVKCDLSEKEIFIGTGGEFHHKMYIKVDDRILSKNCENLDSNENSTYKLFEVVGGDMGKKISDIAINIFDTNNGIVYYTDAKDKKLYSYDIKNNQKQLIIDKMVGSFIIYNNTIYYTDMDNEYKLYYLDLYKNVTNKITDIPVSNLKQSGSTIYFIDNKKRIGIYDSISKGECKYIDVFTTIYDISEDTIYYKNENDNGKLYKIKNDGTENVNITENIVVDIYANDDSIYYIEKNGANLLYRINNYKSEGEFLDIISMAYTDMEIIDGKLYMSVASEGGNYYTIEKYLEDLKFDVYFDLEKQIDKKWKYFVYKVDGYMGYLYKYNVYTNEIKLIVDKWVNDFQIDGDYIYYTGIESVKNINFTTYIDRINVKDETVKNIVSFTDPTIYNISFKVIGDNLYYSLDDSTDGYIWKKNLENCNESAIVSDSSNLEDIVDDWIYYQNTNKRLVRVKLDGSDKQILSKTYSEFIYANKNDLYYLSISQEDSFKGIIMKRNIEDNTKEVVVNKQISLSDLVVVNNKLYYNFEGINLYNMKNGKTTKIYDREVDYFSLVGDVLYISIHDGDNYKTVKKSLQ